MLKLRRSDKRPKNARRLTAEQQEWLLDCLACRMTYPEIIEYLAEEWGIHNYMPSAISYYRHRYADEIERRRELWRANLRSSQLPFVQQFERVARYARYAKIEDKRKRYKEAADFMRRIAEETGDLKSQQEIYGRTRVELYTNLPDAELDDAIARRLAETVGSGDKGAGAPASGAAAAEGDHSA